MGYTHYWASLKEHDLDTWKLFIEDAKKVIDSSLIPLQYDYETACKPVITNDLIHFNGVGDEGHETFVIYRANEENYGFCKTARKDYDVIVCACLILYEFHFPSVHVKSDGDLSDNGWTRAFNLIEKLFDGERHTQLFFRLRNKARKHLNDPNYTLEEKETEDETIDENKELGDAFRDSIPQVISYCPFCGHYVADYDKLNFCPNCGEVLEHLLEVFK